MATTSNASPSGITCHDPETSKTGPLSRLNGVRTIDGRCLENSALARSGSLLISEGSAPNVLRTKPVMALFASRMEATSNDGVCAARVSASRGRNQKRNDRVLSQPGCGGGSIKGARTNVDGVLLRRKHGWSYLVEGHNSALGKHRYIRITGSFPRSRLVNNVAYQFAVGLWACSMMIIWTWALDGSSLRPISLRHVRIILITSGCWPSTE